ncbi:hypothetical protein C8R47DRAFT_660962 [Mycena vitilis]|nr:hypothetical protein C8R47DRAFT_660962 [Mycena vitilis]
MIMIHTKPDEELYEGHQRKTESRLIQTASQLRDVEEKLKSLWCEGDAHETAIASLESRAAEVLLNAEPIRIGRLQDIRLEIAVTKSALQRVVGARERLEHQRDGLLREEVALRVPLTLEAYRAAPIRRLPVDLVVEIFTAAKPKQLEPAGRGIVPLLSQVCQEWRDLACDHAALWASFSFALFDAEAAALAWLQTYLVRSKAALLTLEVDATKQFRKSRPALHALDLLAAHSERLRNLSLVGSHWSSVTLHGFQSRLPRLEKLQFPHMDAEFDQQFAVAPRLHTLTLQSTVPPDGVPVSQITSLHIVGALSPADLLDFSNMTSLAFTFTGEVYPDWTHTTLPGLRSLTVNFRNDPSIPSDFFDYFTTPALKSLEIIALPLQVPLQGRISALLFRSRCQLKSLTLRNCSGFIAELQQLFEHSPDLESLAVVHGASATAVTDKVLELLTVRPGTTALLPNLGHLVLEGNYSVDDTLLVAMLESRSPGSPDISNHLRSVDLLLLGRAMTEERTQGLHALKGTSFMCRP